jgi:hypothetical protein
VALNGLSQHYVWGRVGRIELTADLLILGLGNPLRGMMGSAARCGLLRQEGSPTGQKPSCEGRRASTCAYSPSLAPSGRDRPQQVIIVDAADMGLEAGRFTRFDGSG